MTELSREALWQRGEEIVLAAPQLYLDVDVEADGIAGYGSMVALGAQSPTGESFYSEVRPEGDEFLAENLEFCNKHGLDHDRLLKEAPESTIVMQKFEVWLKELRANNGDKELVFTAFNASFDWSHVALAFVRAGIDNPFMAAPLDLKSLALPLNGKWDFKQTKKANLPEIIVPEGDFTHQALEDAQYQQKLHFGMAALLGADVYKNLTPRL